MNKQIQIELWPECRCNRCKFCNLVLSSEMRGDGSHSNPNIILKSSDKNEYLKKAISYFEKIDWSKYDMLLLRGGEIFNDYDSNILTYYDIFLEKIINKIKEKNIHKLFLITSLKYFYDTSLLKYTIDKLENNNIDITNKILIGTSWDIKYRFNNESLYNWNQNINILSEKSIQFHITSILTQAFIDEFHNKNTDILKIMNYDFDFIPAQGKPELLFLKDFFPKRKDCINFLSELKNNNIYYPIWYRLLHQNHRRAETIYFTEHDSLQMRDLETYKSVLSGDDQKILKCGHPKEYANYVDGDACFLCDLKILSGAC